jgi:hypothetical protein
MTQPEAGIQRKRVRLLVRVILLAVGLNVVAWVGASLGPGARASWTVVSLLLFFLLGLTIGRWWALWVTCAFGLLHAVPVYLGLLPGYLSTWGEALWWVFGLTVLLALTGIGVLVRAAIRRRPSRFAS